MLPRGELMKFSLSQIRKEAFEQPFSFDRKADVSEIESFNNDILKTFPVRVHGTCTIQGEEFLISFTISGRVILPCARTLVEVPYSFDIAAFEVFTTSPAISEEDEEDEIHLVEGDGIDLLPLVKENILLNIPYRVYSENEEDLQQALVQGYGWEVVDEADNIDQEDKEQLIDPRLKKLQQFIDKNNNEK